MKLLLATTALALFICSCATPNRVAQMQGHGTKRVYAAPFDQVWRASIDAGQRGDLEIVNANRANGYIDARRRLQAHTFGENVGIWVREIGPSRTEVEIVSRQAGPPVAWLKNWENEIHRSIAANLTREAVGAAPRETIVVPGSSRGTTVIVPDTGSTELALREQLRRVEELRTQREAGERALASEVDDTKRDMIRREIERLRSELRIQEQRLNELERQTR